MKPRRLRNAVVVTSPLWFVAVACNEADTKRAQVAPAGASGSSAGAGAPGTSGSSAGVGAAAGTVGAAGTSPGVSGGGNAGAAGWVNDALCPPETPLMNAPCTTDGLDCTYPLQFFNGCKYLAKCVNGWWTQKFSGGGPPGPGCDPPNWCPLEEPTLGAWHHPPLVTSSVGPSHCRYPHGDCYVYWSTVATQKSPLGWGFEPEVGGCCTAAKPATGTPCPGLGAQCVYGGEVTTCTDTGWTVGPKAELPP